MSFEIIGDADKDRLYCTGSFTKFLTTFVCLSLLSEKYNLNTILDDDNFLDILCQNPAAKNFLQLFQKLIGNKFSIRDVCSYYSGLPYTFDLSEDEIKLIEADMPFKHHSILDEKTFLSRCENHITPVYTNRCKFHYSEIGIIFLGYLIEKIYELSIESLYKKYVINPFKLKDSLFSRVLPDNVYIQDLSDKYDYPAIAIEEHGYFCYSNGFYTTLNDTKNLLEGLINTPIFQYMADIKKARAASSRLLNGLTLEIRLAGDDIIYGYEGLSFSGCNIWAYSTKHKKGYITFLNSEEEVYTVIYDEKLGYHEFDKVPAYTQLLYEKFIKHYKFDYSEQEIPNEFRGQYKRVKINQKDLDTLFEVGKHFIQIRNPEMVRYEVIYYQGHYRIKGKDGVHGSRVGFHQTSDGSYFFFDGNLYQQADQGL